MAKPKNKTIKNYCQLCLANTNHNVLFQKIENTDVDEENIHFAYTYYVLSCAGCENVSYRTDYDDIDNVKQLENGDLENYTETKVFPLSIRNHRKLKHYYHLPKKIKVLYLEALQCIAGNSKIMAAAAFRAIIEGVCVEEGVTAKTLEEKIKALTVQGIISKNDGKRLHSIRFMGNDAVHNLDSVDNDKIILVLKIIEHFLESLYLLKKASQEMLELPIDSFDDFKVILRSRIRTSNWPDPVTLHDILGNSYRRVKDNIDEFEKEILNEINSGKFKRLKSIGKLYHPSRGEVEHYEVHKTMTDIAGLPSMFE